MSAVTDAVRVMAPGNPIGRSIRDSLVVAKRNLIRMVRIPEVIIFGLIQPIMFVVLFSYVFGGSMDIGGSTSPEVYREFLMAGIFAQTVTFATAGAGAGIAEDMHKGLIDRFRSLPMARGAVLTGRTLADMVQTALTLLVLAVVALLVGWRTHTSMGEVLGAFGLLLLTGYAFTWIGALIGLTVRTPEAATSGGLVWLFPVTFVSNAFVDSSNMTPWLRHIADWNPFSATVQACRELFGNPGSPPRTPGPCSTRCGRR
ncbi:ABC transporter permease [Streptomyces sp. KM77-8]|uniref:ABC transporter permease n=1 Tax=Streptomyces haneummycinicus TaxID=3074435 RepID=A0AAT9HBW4_9ACTN